MNKRPIILLDVDGVLADFRHTYVEACNKVNGTDFEADDTGKEWDFAKKLRINKKQQGKVWDEIRNPGWVGNMPVLGEAQAGVRALCELGSVHFLTAPVPQGHWMAERVAWLRKHFGFVVSHRGQPYADQLHDRVIFCSAKYKHLVQGDFFVDDKHEVVDRWELYWCEQGHPAKGYRAPIGLVTDWEDVHARVHNHFKARE